MSTPVNTALRNSHFEYTARMALGETRFFENERGVVQFNDICQPIDGLTLERFRRADCVCSIVAWRHGFHTFAERAGVQQRGTHRDYILAIRRVVEKLALPTYIVASKRDAMLMSPEVIRPITLFGDTVYLAEWHPLGPAGVGLERAEDLATLLAQRHRAVLDFCCGYGSNLRPFRYFVGADIDTKCLNYIEREIMR